MNTEAWTLWENQVVNRTFPLRRLLGSSTWSAVFLTEHKSKGLRDAAIKLVRADVPQAKDQLARWEAAAALSHPNLVRLFEAGRCQLKDQEFLFVVMEHADQTLAQILRRRALTADEARELLLPTLEALASLHRNQRVHGQLKPSNFLAVDDQLKLASDTIRPAGYVNGMVRATPYDPPELGERGCSTAGDMWSLGVTLLEALTQRTPTWFDLQSRTALLAGVLPAPFGETVRGCLNTSAAERPTVVELGAQYNPATEAKPKPDPQRPAQEATRKAVQPQARETSPQVTPPQAREATSKSDSPQAREAAPKPAPPRAQEIVPEARPLLKGIVAASLISLAAWVGLRFIGTTQDDLQPAAVPAPVPLAVPPVVIEPEASNTKRSIPDSRPAAQPSPPPAITSPSVLNEVIPDVPPKISDKIRGRIYVTVRVLVDPSGNVVGALMEDPGPSKYFARLADNASRQWQFTPKDDQNDRVWLLRFEFRRDGTSVRATPQ